MWRQTRIRFLESLEGRADKEYLARKQEDFLASMFPGHKESDYLKQIVSYSFLKWSLISVILFLIVFAGRAFFLQITKNDQFVAEAKKNYLRIIKIPAKRGLIYDRNKKVLADNFPQFYLSLVPDDLPKKVEEREKTLEEIAKLANLDLEKLKEALQKREKYFSPYSSIILLDNIPYEEAMRLKIAVLNIPGLEVGLGFRRTYRGDFPNQDFAHLIGYLGLASEEEISTGKYALDDYLGKAGVEKSYDEILRGVDGQKRLEVDALGIAKKVISETEPQNGANLILSIDADLQKKSQEILEKYLKSKNLKKGVVIALDPTNGEILSLVSLPTYDNEKFLQKISPQEFEALTKDPDLPLFNRAISGLYPSGSTIKPIFAAGALDKKIISPKTSFLSVGGLRVGNWFFPDWKAGGHGETNVFKALAESVNTFFYIIGGGYGNFAGLGIENLVKYAKLFGLGEKTGIDLPGEKSGFLPTPEWKKQTIGENWYIGDTYHLSIGQGYLLVTPLQIALATSIFANGGVYYQPKVLKAIERNGREEVVSPRVVRQNFVDPQAITVVRNGLRQAVLWGSARALNSLPISVAGKTGTAQGQKRKSPHAWFTGFAPFENPKIVITVLVEEGGEGSSIAVPIAKEILAWYFGKK